MEGDERSGNLSQRPAGPPRHPIWPYVKWTALLLGILFSINGYLGIAMIDHKRDGIIFALTFLWEYNMVLS